MRSVRRRLARRLWGRWSCWSIVLRVWGVLGGKGKVGRGERGGGIDLSYIADWWKRECTRGMGESRWNIRQAVWGMDHGCWGLTLDLIEYPLSLSHKQNKAWCMKACTPIRSQCGFAYVEYWQYPIAPFFSIPHISKSQRWKGNDRTTGRSSPPAGEFELAIGLTKCAVRIWLTGWPCNEETWSPYTTTARVVIYTVR